jgi:hypothetical protein
MLVLNFQDELHKNDKNILIPQTVKQLEQAFKNRKRQKSDNMNKKEDIVFLINSEFALLCSRKGLNGGFDQIQFLQLNEIKFFFRIRQNKQTIDGDVRRRNVSGTCMGCVVAVARRSSNKIEFKIIPVSINNSAENIAQGDHSPFVSMDNGLNSSDFYKIRKEIIKLNKRRQERRR